MARPNFDAVAIQCYSAFSFRRALIKYCEDFRICSPGTVRQICRDATFELLISRLIVKNEQKYRDSIGQARPGYVDITDPKLKPITPSFVAELHLVKRCFKYA